MAIENIQRLFAIIAAEQVMSYLKLKGWQVTNAGDLINCQLSDGAGELQTLSLPVQTTHPRFRKSLPNVIFKLAVIEQREAIEIANAIFESAQQPAATHGNTTAASAAAATAAVSGSLSNSAATSSSTHAAAATPQLVFKNTSDSIATLNLSLDRSIDVPPGQAVCLESPTDATQVVVKFSGHVHIELTGRTPTREPQVWWQASEVPAAELRELWIMQFLAGALDRDGQMPSQKAHSQKAHSQKADKLPAWQTAVERYLFALTGLGQSAADARSWRLATANLLVDLVQSLSASAHWQATVYELTLRLAAIGQQRMKVDPASAEQLWQAAASDSRATPHAVYRWLCNATIA